MTGAEGEAPLLLEEHTDEQIAQELAKRIVAADAFEQTLGAEFVAIEILAQMEMLRGPIKSMIKTSERLSISKLIPDLIGMIRKARPARLDANMSPEDRRHFVWFTLERAAYERGVGRDHAGLKGDTLRWHEQTIKDPSLAHFSALDRLTDPNMLWRFTSQPTKDVIKVDHDVPFSKIIELIGAHSGGKRKDDPSVRTLSFARNLGALIGTAYSAGGDANVASIVVRAEYLYGVDITKLKGTGITAHPAETRLISLFESEYVLVATPGDPQQTLEELATVKLKNPFKSGSPLFQTKILAELKGAAPTPDQPSPDLKMMHPDVARDLKAYAQKVAGAATKQSGVVMSKDRALRRDIEASMRAYIPALPQAPARGGTPLFTPLGQGTPLAIGAAK